MIHCLPLTEWSNLNVNPVVGCYGPQGERCPYCYPPKIVKWFNKFKRNCKLCDQFIPHPHLEQVDKLTPRQKPKFVFIDGFFDWNGERIEKEWLRTILDRITECPQHTFPILSKRPELYDRYGFTYPSNVMLGATVTCFRRSASKNTRTSFFICLFS